MRQRASDKMALHIPDCPLEEEEEVRAAALMPMVM